MPVFGLLPLVPCTLGVGNLRGRLEIIEGLLIIIIIIFNGFCIHMTPNSLQRRKLPLKYCHRLGEGMLFCCSLEQEFSYPRRTLTFLAFEYVSQLHSYLHVNWCFKCIIKETGWVIFRKWVSIRNLGISGFKKWSVHSRTWWNLLSKLLERIYVDRLNIRWTQAVWFGPSSLHPGG